MTLPSTLIYGEIFPRTKTRTVVCTRCGWQNQAAMGETPDHQCPPLDPPTVAQIRAALKTLQATEGIYSHHYTGVAMAIQEIDLLAKGTA